MLGGLSAKFSIFFPDSASMNAKVPIIYYLSGLTCTEDNFMQKAGAQQYASKYGVAIICPDTSPRGANIAGEEKDWDFGTGAGFYLNATQEPWSKYYNMYDYVIDELPNVLKSLNLPIDVNNASIFGHSMGGHGALVCFLRNTNKYRVKYFYFFIFYYIFFEQEKKQQCARIYTETSPFLAFFATIVVLECISTLTSV